MFLGLRYRIHKAVQRYALGGLGGLMALIGLGFLCAAGFMLLLTVTDPITACAIVGCAFLGAGLILMFLARKPRVPVSKPTLEATLGVQAGAPGTSVMIPLAVAFAQGIAQGIAAGRRR
ncbi:MULTISPECIES: phage holin family protein [Roseobacteraceae]|uniref:Putative Actinobacterial holin-X, holin superfamily III n=1 Tax=Pseudosulfitobacter pseudonitzschiae TaxID=1402135 RepID=A0A221K4U8_9RHOB|nr:MULTISPECIES: phage holin family protein [Roseobacteraceae]ASM74028.1 putative Actinobacterial holin-X, holin superfamily III [Pseudosulfitobacter pseudonitzschiae]